MFKVSFMETFVQSDITSNDTMSYLREFFLVLAIVTCCKFAKNREKNEL